MSDKEMKSETREMTCIVCPVGCRLSVALEDGRVTAVNGNSCPRGAAYARSEATNPVRTLTSTVRLTGGELPLVPVRTNKPIPKAKIQQAMSSVRAAVAAAPVKTGDVLLYNVAGSGADVVATRDIDVITKE